MAVSSGSCLSFFLHSIRSLIWVDEMAMFMNETPQEHNLLSFSVPFTRCLTLSFSAMCIIHYRSQHSASNSSCILHTRNVFLL